LTIQEAIKSGKPFRRDNWDWLVNPGDGASLCFLQTRDRFYPCAEDLFATDWEIKREPRKWRLYEGKDGAMYVRDSGHFGPDDIIVREVID
jgi:hypothetical protein